MTFLSFITLTGTSKASRESVLKSLNDEYAAMIRKDMSISDAYEKIVSSRPRRVLAKIDYNNGVPFRSARCNEQAKETDVSSFYTTLSL